MRLTASLVLLAAGGCTALEESESTEAIVSASTPYRYDSPYSIVPDLGVSGIATSASPLATDSASIHEPTFGNGVQSKAAPSTDPTAWHTLASGGPGGSWAQFESAPAFTSELATAESDADANMTDDDHQLADMESFLGSLPLGLHVTHTTAQYFVGWPAMQARWLRQAYAIINTSTGLMANQVYADPSFGAELRERGARLFCAARAAAFNQAATHQASMGKQAALTVSIFGHDIRLGVVEPTFRLDVPKKHIGAGADGTQTFEVPFQVGAQVTPIDGLGLPGFPELRYPVALISGDTEVASALPLQLLHTGDIPFYSPFGGYGTRPLFTSVHPKDYLTVTHADAVRGRSAHLDAHTDNIPLFTMGAFTVYFNAGGTVDVGARTTQDDRLLSGVPSWWPLVSRTGDVSVAPWPGYSYDTKPWTPYASLDAAPGAYSSFSEPSLSSTVSFTPSDPLLLRTLEDDDHHLRAATAVGMTGTVGGDFGFSLGIADLDLRGEGTLGVSGHVSMDVRDGELSLPNTAIVDSTRGGPPPIPLTAVTATPSTGATTSLNLHVWLHIHIPLVFTDIDEDVTFIDATAEHTWGDSPWAQQNRALIATGSSYGDPRIQPWAVSHLPYTGAVGTSYPAYPVFNSFDQDVNACLADPASPPPPPPPCPAPAPTTPPHGNLCVFSGSMQQGYGTWAAWSGVCSSIPAHVDAILGVYSPAAQKKCYVDALTALCKPTALEQDWNGQHGVAHIIDMAHPTNDVDLGGLASECATAFLPQDAKVTFNRIFEFGACDDTAKMYDPSKIFVPGSPPDGTPSPVTPGSCN